MTLKLAIEDAVHKHAPEIERVEEVSAPAPLLQIELSDSMRQWSEAGTLAELSEAPEVRSGLLFVRLGTNAYAYKPGCAICGTELAGGALDGALLGCPGCGSRFDVRHAGRCLDEPERHLERVPLLVGEGGAIRVAAA
jgi:nitrite reductase/ring-hydroxylating ferredoxin subunit